MQGKIFGIPLAIILIVVFIALLVDVPMYYMNKHIADTLERTAIRMEEAAMRQAITPTTIPVPTPSTTPTPTSRVPSRTVIPSTQSAVQK